MKDHPLQQESKLLIDALRSAMKKTPVQLPEAVDWTAFLKLARAHNVEGLVYSGLQTQSLPEQVEKHLVGAYHRAIFRDAQLEHMQTQLRTLLEQEKISHIFLKGAQLKHSYPIPALRTMSDLDVLVYTRDYPGLDRVCARLDGQLLEGDGNHRNFSFPGGVKVEFHPNLVHHTSPVAAGVNPGWQYAVQSPDGRTVMTEEGFYLSILCHMADHFVSGGIGVRFVLDVWVFRNLRTEPVDRTFVEKELERFGLLAFTQKIETLAQAWFGDGEMTPLLEELGDYILTSGSHGTMDRAMLNAVSLSAGGSRSSVLWSKVFYPRQELEDRFPWAKGRPWLLPAAWCVRAFRAVTKNGKQIVIWSKGTGTVSETQVAQQREKLSRFGIEQKKKR